MRITDHGNDGILYGNAHNNKGIKVVMKLIIQCIFILPWNIMLPCVYELIFVINQYQSLIDNILVAKSSPCSTLVASFVLKMGKLITHLNYVVSFVYLGHDQSTMYPSMQYMFSL